MPTTIGEVAETVKNLALEKLFKELHPLTTYDQTGAVQVMNLKPEELKALALYHAGRVVQSLTNGMNADPSRDDFHRVNLAKSAMIEELERAVALLKDLP